jgi:von Willebrand factor type A domain
MLQQKVSIVLDFSESIRYYGLANKVESLYTQIVKDLKEQAIKNNIRTEVSVYTFGDQTSIVNGFKNINKLPENIKYRSLGNTALVSAVTKAINDAKDDSDFDDEDTSYLFLILTDGQENVSLSTDKTNFRQLLNDVDKTGRFTITAHTPYTGRQYLLNYGFKSHNINVWEQTDAGIHEVECKTSGGISNYYTSRSKGIRSVNNFYSPDLSFSPTTLKKELKDVTHQFVTYGVPMSWEKKEIRDFIEKEAGRPYVKGKAFYQLTKKETIQATKELVVRDIRTGHTYSGPDARELLGLPNKEVKVVPATYTNQYELFCQSTSTNRHLVGGTKVLWRE